MSSNSAHRVRRRARGTRPRRGSEGGGRRRKGPGRLLRARPPRDGRRKLQGPPDVVGFMTFTRTHRTVILKWNASDGTPVSIAFIAAYTLSGGSTARA